jgi:hypothetical protein
MKVSCLLCVLMLAMSVPCYAAENVAVKTSQKCTYLPKVGLQKCFETRPPVMVMSWLHKKMIKWNVGNPYMTASN